VWNVMWSVSIFSMYYLWIFFTYNRAAVWVWMCVCVLFFLNKNDVDIVCNYVFGEYRDINIISNSNWLISKIVSNIFNTDSMKYTAQSRVQQTYSVYSTHKCKLLALGIVSIIA